MITFYFINRTLTLTDVDIIIEKMGGSYSLEDVEDCFRLLTIVRFTNEQFDFVLEKMVSVNTTLKEVTQFTILQNLSY